MRKELWANLAPILAHMPKVAEPDLKRKNKTKKISQILEADFF
jgi:hypothetical protein